MNTFARRRIEPFADDPYEQLVAYIANLNRNRWVGNKLYYLASRERTDGTVEHFIDRYN